MIRFSRYILRKEQFFFFFFFGVWPILPLPTFFDHNPQEKNLGLEIFLEIEEENCSAISITQYAYLCTASFTHLIGIVNVVFLEVMMEK